jgi:hypothetical protein
MTGASVRCYEYGRRQAAATAPLSAMGPKRSLEALLEPRRETHNRGQKFLDMPQKIYPAGLTFC